MTAKRLFTAALTLCAATTLTALTARAAHAQAPCSLDQMTADSARDDAFTVLKSERPIVVQLREEQHMAGPNDLSPVSLVKDRFVCAHMASAFDHPIQRGSKFAVLRIGTILYARDPDQQRGTGVFTDSTYKVIMRLGPSQP